MPHDANGNLLKEGDKVIIPGTIKNITTAEDYCNCTVELDFPMPPDNTPTQYSSLNTKQVLLAPVQEPSNAPSD